jgi:hypothetical protein
MKNTQTLKNKYAFEVHSFVSLITNSSSEIFVAADEKTVKAIKEVIDNILKLSNSNLTCDDLFTVEIDYKQYYEDYNYEDDDDDSENNKSKKLTHEQFYEKDCDNECGRNVSLLVKCTDPTSELGKKTAKVLSDLTGLFTIEERYN